MSTFSVRNALGRVASGGRPAAAGAAEDSAGLDAGDDDAGPGAAVPVLPDPVPRDGERALARWGLLGEGAVPVFTPGARYPLAGLLLALPALEGTGLLEAARAGLRPAQGRVLRAGRDAADAGVPGAGRGAAGRGRHPGPARGAGPGAGPGPGAGGQDDPPQARPSSPPPGKAADLIMALARRHAAARPDALGFLYVDGHARVYYGTRHRAEDARGAAEVPRPGHDGDLGHRCRTATRCSWSSPSRRTRWPASCAACSPQLRRIVGEGRRVTVCFDRGGWSPALFADITAAGFDLLTWRKGPAPDLPADEFTTITCTDDRGRAHEYDLADTTVELGISDGPRKGQTVTLRQVTRRVPAQGRRHPADPRADLPHRPAAGEVCWRLSSRWREENYFRYARTRFALDALDSYAAAPGRPGPDGAQPGQEDRGRPHPAGRSRRRRRPRRPGTPRCSSCAAPPPARPPTSPTR